MVIKVLYHVYGMMQIINFWQAKSLRLLCRVIQPCALAVGNPF